MDESKTRNSGVETPSLCVRLSTVLEVFQQMKQRKTGCISLSHFSLAHASNFTNPLAYSS